MHAERTSFGVGLFLTLATLVRLSGGTSYQCVGPNLGGRVYNTTLKTLCTAMCTEKGDCSSFIFKDWPQFLQDGPMVNGKQN